MSNIAIKLENISKQYRLGTVGTGTLSHDLNRWWASVRGKEDPTLKIGQSNVLNKQSTIDNQQSEYVWALKDINLEIKQGEVLGVIGKNGAGKSTLLKLLSQVTGPTTGQIKVNGRIASLLEVGTGFHPELTGRENVFLNGAILGMPKREVSRKFDEIVDFSGVNKYIDTPVKRYSSGMYVRLAFAVAAYLESDILIVDEVLAVGDAEFQKKCLGKMGDVAKSGRTILFVSHNMSSISTLCTSCIYINNGRIKIHGETEVVVNQYLAAETAGKVCRVWESGNPGDDVAKLKSTRLVDEDYNNLDYVEIEKKVGVEYVFEILKDGYNPIPNIHVHTIKGEYVFVGAEEQSVRFWRKGIYKTIMWIPENFLNDETYVVRIGLSSMNPLYVHFIVFEALVFNAIENISKRKAGHTQKIPGVLRPILHWEINKMK